MTALKPIIRMLVLLGVFSCSSAGDDIRQDAPKAEGPSGALQARIDALESDIASGRYGLIDEVLVQHKGDTVLHFTFDQDYKGFAEGKTLRDLPFEYANPDWQPYYKDTDLHTLMSVTKSVASMLVGVLETEGKIPAVSEAKLLELVDDQYTVPSRDANFEAVTLEHLLTLRANIKWNEDPNWGWTKDLDEIEDVDTSKNDLFMMFDADDWIQYILNQPMLGAPGEAAPWFYNGGATMLLSAVINNVTGMSAAEYAEEKLFGPMGIEDYFWTTSPKGINDAQEGLYLKSTDLIKFCKLMTNDGVWEGRRLISEDYVRRSLTGWTDDFGDNEVWPPKAYGYKWWLSDPAFADKSAFLGSGYGGQYLTCLPEQDVSMVTYGWNLPDVLGVDLDVHYRTAAWEIRKRVNDEILPLL